MSTNSYYSDYRTLSDESYLLEIYTKRFQGKGLLETYHWHHELEIVLCCEGITDVYCNGEKYRLNENDIILINSSQIHSLDMHSYSSNVALVLDLDSLISECSDECDRHFLLPLKNMQLFFSSNIITAADQPQTHAQIVETIHHIIDSQTTKPIGYQLDMKSSVYRLLFLFQKALPLLSGDSASNANRFLKNYDYLKDVLRYMNTHYMENIRIEDLSAIPNMSHSYFCKYFKKFIGKTPIVYLTTIRIENAAKLLRTTNKRILDIAYDVGFQNISYFSRAFLKYKGMTPSDYRIMAKKERQ